MLQPTLTTDAAIGRCRQVSVDWQGELIEGWKRVPVMLPSTAPLAAALNGTLPIALRHLPNSSQHTQVARGDRGDEEESNDTGLVVVFVGLADDVECGVMICTHQRGEVQCGAVRACVGGDGRVCFDPISHIPSIRHIADLLLLVSPSDD